MNRARWIVVLLLVLLGAACSRRPTTFEGRLYYTVEQAGHFRIEWVDPEGSSTEVLLGENEEARSPAVSPDGKSLAYLKGSPPRVHVLDLVYMADQQASMTRDTPSRPAWSPVGQQLAYLCYPMGGKTQLVVQPAGGKPRVLYEALNLGIPTWHPGGSRILYPEVDASGTSRIYSQKLDGSERDLVLNGATQVSMATLGTEAAVVLDDKLQLYDLYSRKLSVVVDQPGIDSPTWSPSGKQLGFVREGQVWTVAVDGSALRQITNSESSILDVSWGRGF